MSLNVQLNEKEVISIIIENVLKLIERRKLIDSWETEYKKLETDLQTKTQFELVFNNDTKCGIYLVNTKLTTIVKGTPLDQYLSTNTDMHKFIIVRDAMKKVVKQIIHEYKNAEFFFESEMLEDIPSKIFIPKHEIMSIDEKKELLSKYSEAELSKILSTDIMCRYYHGKVGDIFKITRYSFTAGYSIFYRKVINGSLDVLFNN
jgi:DNA-directed RNA polymerase subunit H (RpoH/RPB5)